MTKASIIFRLILFTGLLSLEKAQAQDTLCLDMPTEYYSETDTTDILYQSAYLHYPRAQYARELILFNKDSSKLEYCFYYDNKRYAHLYKRYIYYMKNDSLLSMTYNSYTEDWIYTQLNDSLFALKKQHGKLTESGFAKSLMPLEKIGVFTTTNTAGDTLWLTKYKNIIYPKIEYPEEQFKEEVYRITEIMPEYETGDQGLLKYLYSNLKIQIPVIENYTPISLVIISLVIDKNCEMKNIKIDRSCGDAIVDQQILRAVGNLGDFKCGYLDSEPVNVRLKIPLRIRLEE